MGFKLVERNNMKKNAACFLGSLINRFCGAIENFMILTKMFLGSLMKLNKSHSGQQSKDSKYVLVLLE